MKKTALNETHRTQGAKMVEFAGYEMPITYPLGMLKEHEWVRAGNVGVFDVSHMGQFMLEGSEAAEFLSKITPTNFTNVAAYSAKYTVLTNHQGGIIDDLIITRLSNDKFFIVLNAGCKAKDANWISSQLPVGLEFVELSDRSLIAIQGSKAESVLKSILSEGDLPNLAYMNLGLFKTKRDEDVFISRTGYTGEDGFEVSIKNSAATNFWADLCAIEEVEPIGLGARDSLRLEMGYPLYGHDLDDTTSPIEASIGWVVSKDHVGFIGESRILAEKTSGTIRKRMGVKLLEKGIAREGCEIQKNGKKIGFLSSGGYSPELKISIGQGYFNPSEVKLGDKVVAIVRDREIPAEITSFVFVNPRTKSLKK